MDFVRKKALQTQMNRVGRELGLSGGRGASTTERVQQAWNSATSRTGGGNNENAQSNSNNSAAASESAELDVFDTNVACVFANKRKNFPPLLKWLYVERAILSDAARTAVSWALYTLCLCCVMIVVNVASNITLSAIKDGDSWINIVLAISVGALVMIFEVVAYETAFRGAYRTSSKLRMRYIWMSVANVLLFSAYTFVGGTWLNGWTAVSRAGKESGSTGAVRRWLAIVEAVGWTCLLFVNMYNLFEYYNLLKGREQGLCEEALNEATRQGGAFEGAAATAERRPNGIREADRARIQEIRDRYAIGQA